MSDKNRNDSGVQSSRRTLLKAGGAAAAASGLGLTGTAAAQDDGDDETTQTEGDGETTQTDWDAEPETAWMFNDEVRQGAVFRVMSPPLEDIPEVEGIAGTNLENATARVVEYFNTSEEAMLLLPEDAQVEEGALYELDPDLAFIEDAVTEGLVRIEVELLENQDVAFDLDDADIELLDGGGEGAVRPRNFSAGAFFRIASGPQGWVPEDVADSGFFTDYNTHHAQYLGTDDEFLFFPQEGAEVESGGLYVVRDEWEFFDPEGNLVAVEFDRVNEESLPIDEDLL